MRISARSDYAVRAMAQLAADSSGQPIKAERLAAVQDIPLKFLLSILGELRHGHLVRSIRGADGGYLLRRPAKEISIADVIRAVDGPLATVRDLSLTGLTYDGAAAALPQVWMAVRAALRSVLEAVSLADLKDGRLPPHVLDLARTYREDDRRPGPVGG